MSQRSAEILVVGGGIAGRSAAASLSEQGFSPVILEARDRAPNKALFVNENNLPPNLVDYARAQDGFINVPYYSVVDLDDETRSAHTGEQQRFSTALLDHDATLDWLGEQTPGEVQTINASYRKGTETPNGVRVELSSGDTIHAGMVIDAGGDRSPALRKTTGLDGKVLLGDDPLIFRLFGARFQTPDHDPTAYTPVGESVGLPWIVTNGKGEVDIIDTGGHHRYSDVEPVRQRREKLARTIEWTRNNTKIRVGERIMPLGGVIRLEPIPYTAATNTERVFAVGGAAGMAEPLMAELVSPALRYGLRMGEKIKAGASPSDFYKDWLHDDPMFRYELYLAIIKRREAANRDERSGKTTELYKLLLDSLSPDQQQRMLDDSKVPRDAVSKIALSVLKNPKIIPNLAELSVYWAKEKAASRTALRALDRAPRRGLVPSTDVDQAAELAA